MAAASPIAGAMAGLGADAARVRTLVAGSDAVIAAYNGPEQTVISGPRPAVEAVMCRARDAGIAAAPRATSHAFHSPLMAAATAPLRDALRAIPPRPRTRAVAAFLRRNPPRARGACRPGRPGLRGELGPRVRLRRRARPAAVATAARRRQLAVVRRGAGPAARPGAPRHRRRHGDRPVRAYRARRPRRDRRRGSRRRPVSRRRPAAGTAGSMVIAGALGATSLGAAAVDAATLGPTS